MKSWKRPQVPHGWASKKGKVEFAVREAFSPSDGTTSSKISLVGVVHTARPFFSDRRLNHTNATPLFQTRHGPAIAGSAHPPKRLQHPGVISESSASSETRPTEALLNEVARR